MTYYEFREQNLKMPSYRYREILWLTAAVSEEILSQTTSSPQSLKVLPGSKYRVYQNDWSGFEVDYIHKYGEQNYKY